MRFRNFASLLTIGVGACSNPLCTNEVMKTLSSPGGEHKAILFMRECGATTDFTTQVSVDPGLFETFGNVFVADGYNGGTRGPWGGPWADLEWVGPNQRLITYDQQARIFDRNGRVNGVSVAYRSQHR